MFATAVIGTLVYETDIYSISKTIVLETFLIVLLLYNVSVGKTHIKIAVGDSVDT